MSEEVKPMTAEDLMKLAKNFKNVPNPNYQYWITKENCKQLVKMGMEELPDNVKVFGVDDE